MLSCFPSCGIPTFLGALVHFERVAARSSFARAASDLGVTPSAVSHRIARLEAALGRRLLERSPRRVLLTAEGAELCAALQLSFEQIRGAVDAVVGRQVLRVSVGPYLSTVWLMPRLARFEREHPGARVDLLHRAGWPDLRDVDLALVWHDRPPDGAMAVSLFEPVTVPVAAPGFPDDGPLWLQGLPALHYRNRDAWRGWLRSVGGPQAFADRGEVFEDPIVVLEAAAHGRGVAIGFLPFIAGQLASGRLVCVDSRSARCAHRYWLVRTASVGAHVEALSAWLAEEASATPHPGAGA